MDTPPLKRVKTQLAPQGSSNDAAFTVQAFFPSEADFASKGTIILPFVQHYRDHGFCLLRGLVSEEEMDSLREELEYFRNHCPSERGGQLDADGKSIPGSPSAYSFVGGGKPKGDDERTFIASDDLVLTRINGAVSFPPEDTAGAAARKMAAHPSLLKAVERIYGEDFIPYGDSYVVKPPQDGAGWDWHQVLCFVLHFK